MSANMRQLIESAQRGPNWRVMIDSEDEAEQLAMVQAKAAIIRANQVPACETCPCAACVEKRDLPRVLNILAAAARRKS